MATTCERCILLVSVVELSPVARSNCEATSIARKRPHVADQESLSAMIRKVRLLVGQGSRVGIAADGGNTGWHSWGRRHVAGPKRTSQKSPTTRDPWNRC